MRSLHPPDAEHKGFGTLPNKLFCRAKYVSGYTLPMLATVTLSSYSPSTNTTI